MFQTNLTDQLTCKAESDPFQCQ